MIEPLIIDRFTAFDRVRGNEPLPFKLDGDREPRADIPQWQQDLVLERVNNPQKPVDAFEMLQELEEDL